MKPSIVILSAFLTPFRSGAEACVEEVSLRLKNDFDITIITAKLRRDLPRNDVLNGVSIRRVGIGHPIDKWLFPFLAPLKARSGKPKAIHAVLETFAGLALTLSHLTSPSIKKILTLQTTNRTFLKSFIIRQADLVTAISSPLVKIAKESGKDAVLIPNGIDLKAYEEARKKYKKVPGRILFVGRLEPMKGVDTLLIAFAELLNAQVATSYSSTGSEQAQLRATSSISPKPEARSQLRIVGDGSERSRLEALALELGITDKVTFVGRVEPADIPKEFAEASIFCGLSRSEALGNVFIEAQAAGCVVIGSNVGGIPDTVKHGHTGLLVPPNDPAKAKDALFEVLGDIELSDSLRKEGMVNAASYNWDDIAQKYKEIYTGK